jgi:hypothetical protein
VGAEVKVFYACGTDHASKCGLSRGNASFGVVIVPREGEALPAEKPDRHVFVAEAAQGEIASLSSTKVRAALKSKDQEFVASALSPEAAKFILSPTDDELRQFAADFQKLGVKTATNRTCSSSPEPRQVFISLSSLMSNFDRKGDALLQQIPSNALFFFGSKRSWVFPDGDEQLNESRNENPRYTAAQYQPLRDLIVEKETRGEVFFLKPPGFKYNGNLYHGDPAAFSNASDWLVTLDDPVSGKKYNPLKLDESWWQTEWDKSTKKYTSAVMLIVKNFKNGAHDYAPVMELLHQSNPTLQIIH